MNIALSVKPDAPVGEKWALHISPNKEYLMWEDPDLVTLQGFETAHDAFVFAFCHFHIDVSVPGSCRLWTLSPEEVEPVQLKLI